jgi:hypothetical protein
MKDPLGSEKSVMSFQKASSLSRIGSSSAGHANPKKTKKPSERVAKIRRGTIAA